MFLTDRTVWFRIALYVTLIVSSILLTRSSGDIAMIWLANAAAIFLCVDQPSDRLWKYAVAFWSCNFLINVGIGDSISFSSVISLANQIEIWTVVFLLRRFVGSNQPMRFDIRVLRTYMILTAGPLASAMVGVPLLHIAYGDPLLGAFVHWFIADYISLIIVGGLFVHWRNFPEPFSRTDHVNTMEVPVLIGSAVFLYFLQFNLSGQWYLAAVLPVIWAALRLPDVRGAIMIGLASLGMILLLPTAFARNLIANPEIGVLEAQIIIGIIALSGNVVHQLNCFKIRAIAELEAINAKLTESRELADLAGEIGQIGHWRMNIRDGSLDWNERMHLIHGTDPAQFRPDLYSMAAFYTDSNFNILQLALDQAIEDQSDFEFVARMRRPDGIVRTVQTIGKVTRDELGHPDIAYGVLQDITERKREEELQRAYLELERFSYACSHDLSEPTRLLSVLTDMLIADEGPNPDPERAELLDSINRNARRLNELVTNLLAFSRAGGIVASDPVDLDSIRSDVSESLMLLIGERKARLVAADLGKARGSDVLFRQIFQNLLSNALRHARFSAKAEIRITRIPDPAGLHLVFGDNGEPVSEQTFMRINDALQTQSSDLARKKGLGLWITASIVRKQGGRIWFSRDEQGHSEFHVVLPGQTGQAALPHLAA